MNYPTLVFPLGFHLSADELLLKPALPRNGLAQVRNEYHPASEHDGRIRGYDRLGHLFFDGCVHVAFRGLAMPMRRKLLSLCERDAL
jgi:hypothetical protein